MGYSLSVVQSKDVVERFRNNEYVYMVLKHKNSDVLFPLNKIIYNNGWLDVYTYDDEFSCRISVTLEEAHLIMMENFSVTISDFDVMFAV